MFFFSLEKLWKEQLELRCMFSVLCIPLRARCPSLQSSVYTGVYLTYPFCCLPRRLEFTIGLARTVMQPYLIRHFHISYIHLVCPPKFYPSISRGKILIARRNKKTNVMQRFGGWGWGGHKVGDVKMANRPAPFHWCTVCILLNFYPLENSLSTHASPTGHSLALSYQTALLGTTPLSFSLLSRAPLL